MSIWKEVQEVSFCEEDWNSGGQSASQPFSGVETYLKLAVAAPA